MADLTGQHLGQYLILERISKGATSTVYKAYQEKLERYVAVKVLAPHFIDEEGFLERFKREARAVAQLDHPNILPVYDFDQVGDVVYIVMKYVETGTLKDLMGKPMDPRVALEIFTQIGLALGYAHRQGVIHRDVKPGNILLGEGNWALLTDFGLAKIRAGDHKLTKSGIGMGTPDYMAPEQAQGLPVDGRADLYSLGCMLHEMLTGRVPFESDSGMAVVVKHITEPPRPPREFNPNLSLAVEQVILRALEKDASKRHQAAEAMVADLTRAIGRGDQVFFTTESPQPATTSALPRSASRPKPRPTEPGTTTTPAMVEVKVDVWRVRRAAFVTFLRRAGRWLMANAKRVAVVIGIGLKRLGSGLRRAALAIARAVPRGFARARETIGAWIDRRRAAPARSAPRPRSAAAAKRKSKAAPLTPAQAFFADMRERLPDRRVLAASVIALLLILLLAMALGSGGNVQGQATPSQSAPTSVAVVNPTDKTATANPKPTTVTPKPATALPTEAPTQVPTVEATATPLPEAPAGMVTVAGGTFKMGATAGSFDASETPPHWVTVSPFYIDVVEVTVAQFARFANGSGYKSEAEKRGDATTWRNFDAPDRQRYPITLVSWSDAAALCRWYGKRLPTEAEWELAAKGYSTNIYPWGNDFAGDRLNTVERGIGQPIAVAQLNNVSPFGAYDMVGNVWEWVADWYDGGYYAASPAANPKGPASGLERVVRGGSFKSDGTRATTTVRGKGSQDGWSDDVGFRCVKDIP